MQHLVAFLVAIAVVDDFEIIDIQQQEGQRRTVFAGSVEGLLGAFEEVPAVAALGQHVGGGQALQLAFSYFFSMIFGNADDDHPVVLALLVDVALVAQPAHLAVGIENTVFAVLHRALDQHLGQAALGELQVVGVNAVAPFVVVGQHQVGSPGRPRNALVGGADVQHLAGFPIEGPEHALTLSSNELNSWSRSRRATSPWAWVSAKC